MLDANIALQARGPEYQSPVAQYTKLLQLKDLMRQGQMGDLQAQEAAAGLREKEALRAHLAGAPNLDTPEGQAALYGVAPTQASGILKGRLDLRKTEADIGHIKGQTSKDAATEAQTRQQTKTSAFNQHLQELAGVRNPVEAQRWVQGGLAKGIGDMRTASEAMQGIPQDPIEFERWKHGQRIAGVDLAKQFDLANADRTHGLAVQQFGETGRHNKATEANTVLGINSTAATAAAGRKQAESHFQAGQNAPQYMETDAGLVALPKRLGPGAMPVGTMVAGPDGQPLGKPLKAIPPAVNSAIISNAQSGAQIDRALQLLSGKNIGDPAQGGMQGDAAATGFKGYLPQSLLNRVDPSGTAARAEIADIGSLKIHDRSGAAVTISEAPRLMPFIPVSTDDAVTVQKKLQRLRLEIANESDALRQTYSKEQGYKPSPIAPVAPSATSVPDDIAAILRKHGGK